VHFQVSQWYPGQIRYGRMPDGKGSAEHVFIDSTHVKASANKPKFEKKVVRKETRAYQEKLQEEINLDREDHGKKPFPPDKFDKEETKEINELSASPAESEAPGTEINSPIPAPTKKDCRQARFPSSLSTV
jgi:hypothetical protein